MRRSDDVAVANHTTRTRSQRINASNMFVEKQQTASKIRARRGGGIEFEKTLGVS